MSDKNKLGAVIKELREGLDISQAQLAERIGKSTGTVGQYERGEIYPNYEALSKIVDFFDVDANIYFSRENTQYSIESLLALKLFSQMEECEIKAIIKFHKDLSRLLNFLGNNTVVNNDDEKIL